MSCSSGYKDRQPVLWAHTSKETQAGEGGPNCQEHPVPKLRNISLNPLKFAATMKPKT